MLIYGFDILGYMKDSKHRAALRELGRIVLRVKKTGHMDGIPWIETKPRLESDMRLMLSLFSPHFVDDRLPYFVVISPTNEVNCTLSNIEFDLFDRFLVFRPKKAKSCAPGETRILTSECLTSN